MVYNGFRRRYIYKKKHYLTFDFDLGVKVIRIVAQYPLHCVTYSATKFEVTTPNGLEGDTFTKKVPDARTDGRWTDFQTKLIIQFFLKKGGINVSSYGVYLSPVW